MKIIVKKDTNISYYVFEDSKTITVKNDCIDCDGLVICDLNSSNAKVVSSTTKPDDWLPVKYTFDGTNWELNPNYEEPQFAQIPQPVIE